MNFKKNEEGHMEEFGVRNRKRLYILIYIIYAYIVFI